MIKKLIQYLQKIGQKWHWILLSMLFFGTLLGYYAYLEEPTYETYIQFSLKNKQTISALANAREARRQRWLNRRKRIRQSNQIVAYATTQPILEVALLKKVNLNGRADFLANHIITAYELFSKEKITSERMASLIDFKFQHATIDQFGTLELKALRRVRNYLKGKKRGLLKANYDRKTDLLTLSATGKTPTLPELMLQVVFEQLDAYYLQKEYSPLLLSKEKLTKRLADQEQMFDSLRHQLIVLREQQNSYFSTKKRLPRKKLVRPLRFLYKNRAQLEKDILALDFASLQMESIFQVYHLPEKYPFPTYHRSVSTWTILGILIGGMLGVLGIFFSKLFFTILAIWREVES